MKIYVDFDDVLCETAAHLCDVAARAFYRHVPYERVFRFNLQQVFGLDDAEMARFMTLAHEPASLATHRVTPGAPEGVRALRAAHHDVTIVTGRPASAHAPTEAWLAAHGLGTCPVVYVDKYGRDAAYAHNPGDPPTLALDALLARHYDVVIDDSPEILARLEVWRDTRILVFDRPWNAAYRLAPNMRRVRSWAEICAVLGVALPDAASQEGRTA